MKTILSNSIVDRLGFRLRQFSIEHSKSANLRKKLFREIIGHDDIKKIFTSAILSKKPVHILLIGPPGSAKTMFLTEISRHFRESLFAVGINTTKAGLLDQLFSRRPKFILIDELEKMKNDDQASLLHLMETGLISETKIAKTRSMLLNSWVFATSNSYEKIAESLLSRFVVLEVPKYTFEEFREIVIYRLARENLASTISNAIAEGVWNGLHSSDVRDAVKVGRLAKNPEDVQYILAAMRAHMTGS